MAGQGDGQPVAAGGGSVVPPGTVDPVGVVTRGTTGPNRLRRMDRWLVHVAGRLLRSRGTAGGADGAGPTVVDLGFGAAPVTTVELHRRLARLRPDVRVVGLEIDPERVAAGRAHADAPAVTFGLGGFELPVPRPPVLVRAANVLRQYPEEEVAGAWTRLAARTAPDGLLVEGTCDELGRLGSWVTLTRGPDGRPRPRWLTLSWRLAALAGTGGAPGAAPVLPSVVAERLPKALIHRNVSGEPVHAFLAALDREWRCAAAWGGYGPRQRLVATAEALRAQGWPVRDGPRRWRLGELTVAWAAVRPADGPLAG